MAEEKKVLKVYSIILYIFFRMVLYMLTCFFAGFTPLRLRCHEAHDDEKMEYDDWYTEYIQRLGLLPFITLVTRSVPWMNPYALTALVDR
jgi:hypothetical protein